MEHTKLIEDLTKSIEFEERNKQDMDVCSWPLQEGILISGNDAKIVVELANHHAHLVDALEKMVKLVRDIDETLFHHNHNIEGWHLNGELEPIMNFVDNYDMEALQIAQETLNKLKTI